MADATPGSGVPSSNRNVMILLSYLWLLALIPLASHREWDDVPGALSVVRAAMDDADPDLRNAAELRLRTETRQALDLWQTANTEVRAFNQQILPAGLPATTVWGYGAVKGMGKNPLLIHNAPSLTIEADWNRPVRVKWINELVDGQGNFGSVDGDPPAAMRYTEVRLNRLAHEFLADLDKETVDFVPNYDASLVEPSVLPTGVPNLLINGAAGIAVGMAANIPPHNLNEIISAAILLIQKPGTPLEKILELVKGPDFPSGGPVDAKQHTQ